MQGEQEIPTIFIADELATGIRYDDVYISPSHMKFDEAFEGVTYRQRITIKNIGYKPAFVRIRQLNSIVSMPNISYNYEILGNKKYSMVNVIGFSSKSFEKWHTGEPWVKYNDIRDVHVQKNIYIARNNSD